MNPLQLLKKSFGYPNFRPGQLEIILDILAGKPTLAILPTGGGKSICFQVPGLMLPGITIVISPLISLITDQVKNLIKNNIPAVAIYSGQSRNQQRKMFSEIQAGKYKFIYVAPERLGSKKFQQLVSSIEVSLLVIDEAHCISQWGHDFRPSYLKIAKFAQDLLPPNYKICALTATANPETQRDILTQLNMSNPAVHLNSFRRDNLIIKLFHTHHYNLKELMLLRILLTHQGESGIIYTASRAEAEQLQQLLQQLRPLFSRLPQLEYYHAGLPQIERSQVQQNFISGKTPVISATNAFGMGIDKPDIRFVIHYQIPGSIENYYQEIGRAGRDGGLSCCYFLFHQADLEIHKTLIFGKKYQPKAQLEKKLSKLRSMLKFAQTKTCLNTYLMQYFGEKSDRCPKKISCSNCLPANYLESPKEEQWQEFFSQNKPEFISKLNVLFLSLLLSCAFPEEQPSLRLLLKIDARKLSKLPGIGQGWLEAWQTCYNTPHDNSTISSPVSDYFSSA